MATSPYNRRNNPMAGKTGAMSRPAQPRPAVAKSVPRGTRPALPLVKGKMPMPPPMPRRPRG